MAQNPHLPTDIAHIAKALQPYFDQTRQMLAEQMAQAENGHLVEQTEMPIFEALNRLKNTSQQVGLQARIHAEESDFSPCRQARPTAQ